MESMQMDKEKKLLQHQPHQQQPNQQKPQLPGAAAPDPRPPPMSTDVDESNSEREIGRHGFPGFCFGRQGSSRVVCIGKMQCAGGWIT